MSSTATTRLQLEKQGLSENQDGWGTRLNTNFDILDGAITGSTSFALSGTKTLSNTDYNADEASKRIIWVTSGTGGTITIPNVEKLYKVFSDATGDVTITCGGLNAVVPPGVRAEVYCDGTNVTSLASDSWRLISTTTLSGTSAATYANLSSNYREMLWRFNGVSHGNGANQNLTFECGVAYANTFTIGNYAASATIYGDVSIALWNDTVCSIRIALDNLTADGISSSDCMKAIAVRNGALTTGVRFRFGGVNFDAGLIYHHAR